MNRNMDVTTNSQPTREGCKLYLKHRIGGGAEQREVMCAAALQRTWLWALSKVKDERYIFSQRRVRNDFALWRCSLRHFSLLVLITPANPPDIFTVPVSAQTRRRGGSNCSLTNIKLWQDVLELGGGMSLTHSHTIGLNQWWKVAQVLDHINPM